MPRSRQSPLTLVSIEGVAQFILVDGTAEPVRRNVLLQGFELVRGQVGHRLIFELAGLLVELSSDVDLRATDNSREAILSCPLGTTTVRVARRCGGFRGLVVRVRGLGVRRGLGRRGMVLVLVVLRLV